MTVSGPAPAAAAAADGTASTVGKVPRANMVIAETYDAWADLGPRDVHPWHRPAQPSHEDIKASPHYPVFITANPMAGSQVRGGGGGSSARALAHGALCGRRAVRSSPRAAAPPAAPPPTPRHWRAGARAAPMGGPPGPGAPAPARPPRSFRRPPPAGPRPPFHPALLPHTLTPLPPLALSPSRSLTPTPTPPSS
jgi:hypothetical protein